MEELSGRARQRAHVAVRIVGTFAGEVPHHVDCIVNRYLVRIGDLLLGFRAEYKGEGSNAAGLPLRTGYVVPLSD